MTIFLITSIIYLPDLAFKSAIFNIFLEGKIINKINKEGSLPKQTEFSPIYHLNRSKLKKVLTGNKELQCE